MLLQQILSNSYLDPGYDELELRVASEIGVPPEALRGIRTRGERSNRNQVSPAGARTVYQIIPSTRRGLQRRHGVDAYASDEDAVRAAALHLRDDYERTGSWDESVIRYHGGPNRRNWGPRTRAYAERVGPIGSPVVPPELDIPDSYDPRFAGAEPMQQTPEPDKLNVPVPGPGPSAPVTAGKVPAEGRRRRGGVMGFLGDVFMPEPDSLWAGALRGGLVNARESQAQYRQGQADAEQTRATAGIERQRAEVGLKRLLTQGDYQIMGNSLVHFPAGGGPPVITAAPQNPGETERLIDRWRSTPPGPERELIERAIRGVQYTPEVISAQGAARERAAAAGAGARERNTRTRNYGLPPGYVLEN